MDLLASRVRAPQPDPDEYGALTSDYPHFPVMTDERWCLVNAYRSKPEAVRAALHDELKHAYCSTRRLGVDRMGCGAGAGGARGAVNMAT